MTKIILFVSAAFLSVSSFADLMGKPNCFEKKCTYCVSETNKQGVCSLTYEKTTFTPEMEKDLSTALKYGIIKTPPKNLFRFEDYISDNTLIFCKGAQENDIRIRQSKTATRHERSEIQRLVNRTCPTKETSRGKGSRK